MPSLIVNPIGGIANRLRAIVAGASLAKELKVSMQVVWAINSELAAPVDELIDIEGISGNGMPDIRIHNISALKQLFLYDASRKRNFYASGITKFGKYGYELDDDKLIKNSCILDIRTIHDTLSKDRDILIRSGLEFFDFTDEFYRQLIHPLSRYEAQATDILKGMKDTVGLHIRRTDNAMSVRHSPLTLFFNAVDLELKHNPETNFYLASDDEDTKKVLVERYGGDRIVTSSLKADRSSASGIKNAFLEMVILSKCSKIYGSFYSSFSEAASKLGNVRLETLRTPSS